MYGGAHGLAVRSLLSLQKYLLERDYDVEFDIVANGSRLPNVRNGMVNRFLASGADKFLFIDSDMVYSPEDIEKLINSPFDVSVINYRKKTVDVVWNAEPSIKDGSYSIKVYGDDVWLETKQAGTGLMCCSKDALLMVKGKYPHPFYFEVIDGEDVGEDYVFCKRLTELGGKIFILPDAYAAHLGDTVYGGNYEEYIKERQQNGV